MTRRTGRNVLLGLGAVLAMNLGGLRLEAQTTAERDLEMAILVEESEHDLARARAMYGEILGTAGIGSVLKSRTLLRLGLCLIAMGLPDEGWTTLTEAAEGEGPGAEEAKTLLSDRDKAGIHLRARIQQLLVMLGSGKESIEAAKELIWIGEPAVPFLVEAIQAEQINLDFIQDVLSVMIRVGGKQACALFDGIAAGNELILKRTLVKSMAEVSRYGIDPAVTASFARLLEDPDPSLRHEALCAADRTLPSDLLVKATTDDAARVRARALHQIASRNGRTEPRVMEALGPRLVQAIERVGSDGGDTEWEQALFEFLSHGEILATRAGRTAFLTGLELPGSERFVVGGRIWFQNVERKHASLVEPPRPGEFRSAMRALGTEERREGSAATTLSNIVEKYAPRFERTDFETAIEMAQTGSSQLTFWVAEHAPESMQKRLVEALPGLPDPTPILQRLGGEKIREESLAPLGAFLLDYIQPDGRAKSSSDGIPTTILGRIAEVGTEHSARTLLDLVRKQPDRFYREVVTSFTIARHLDAAANRSALAELVTLPSRDQDAGRSRHWALVLLTLREEEAMLDKVVPVYELSPDLKTSMYLDSLLAQRSADPALVARAFEVALETDNPDIWRDAHEAIREADKVVSNTIRVVPDPVLAVLQRKAFDCPLSAVTIDFANRALRAREADPEAYGELLSQTLRKGNTDLIETALGRIRTDLRKGNPRAARWRSEIATIDGLLKSRDTDVVNAALAVLQRLEPANDRSRRVALLSHASPNVRASIAYDFATSGDRTTLDLILPLLSDESDHVRVRVAEALGNLVDEKAVPGLIEALRDPSSGVRNNARRSLETIQLYLEQRKHWKSWMESLSLEAETAAEALLRQTKKEQPVEVRVAAIESLGTLAVPETLPFLVELLKDEEPRVVAAAKAALARVNSAGTATGTKKKE